MFGARRGFDDRSVIDVTSPEIQRRLEARML